VLLLLLRAWLSSLHTSCRHSCANSALINSCGCCCVHAACSDTYVGMFTLCYALKNCSLSHNNCTLCFLWEPLLLHYSLLLVDYLYMKLLLLLLYTNHLHYCTLVVHYCPTPLPLLYACHATAKDTISTFLTVCTARITDTLCLLHICKLEPKYRRYTHCSCAAAAATSTCCCTKKLHAHTGVHCTLLHSLLVTLVYSHCAPVVVPYRARTHTLLLRSLSLVTCLSYSMH
jgi:hypothetical protein